MLANVEAESEAVATAAMVPVPTLVASVNAVALPSVFPVPENALDWTLIAAEVLEDCSSAVDMALPPIPPLALPPDAISRTVAELLPVTVPVELLMALPPAPPLFNAST